MCFQVGVRKTWKYATLHLNYLLLKIPVPDVPSVDIRILFWKILAGYADIWGKQAILRALPGYLKSLGFILRIMCNGLSNQLFWSLFPRLIDAHQESLHPYKGCLRVQLIQQRISNKYLLLQKMIIQGWHLISGHLWAAEIYLYK